MEDRSFGPIRFLAGENRGRYPFCHSLYIEGAGVLIDPASDRERLIRLRAEEGVKMVWLSHWHEDHFMHLDLFEDLPFWMAEADAPPLADAEVFLDWYDLEDEAFRAWWRTALKEQFHYRPRRPARTFQPGEVIPLGALTAEVIPAPGHTPGHTAFLFREPEILFLGDYDLTKFGPWYGDRYSSIEDTIASVARLRKVPARKWLASHETGVFEDQPGELWDQYLKVIETREDKLIAFLSSPRTLAEIAAQWIVYGRPREPRAFFEFGERALMQKHVQRLMTAGKVARQGEAFVRASG